MKVRVTIDLDIDAEAYAQELGKDATRDFINAELAAILVPATYRFFGYERPGKSQCNFTAVDPDAEVATD